MTDRNAVLLVDRYRANPRKHQPGDLIPSYDSPVEPGAWNVRADHECDALRLTSPGGYSIRVALDQRQTPGSRDVLAHCLQMSLRALSELATEELTT